MSLQPRHAVRSTASSGQGLVSRLRNGACVLAFGSMVGFAGLPGFWGMPFFSMEAYAQDVSALLPRPPRPPQAQFGLRGSVDQNGRRVSRAENGQEDDGSSIFGDAIENDDLNQLTRDGFSGEDAEEPVVGPDGLDEDGIRRRPPQLSDQSQGAEQPVPREPGVLDETITGSTPSALANRRAEVVEPGQARALADEPFAPTGVRRGTFNIFARLEQTIGYTTNAASTALSDGGWVSSTIGRIQAVSDWSRHALNIEADANWTETFGDDGESFPTANINSDLRLDLLDGHTANLRGLYNFSTESTTSNNIDAAVTNRPGVHTFGASAALSRTGYKLGYDISAGITRTIFEDAELNTGGSESQADRFNTLYGLRGRLSYEVSPAITPFVEGELGWRVFDDQFDRNGQERDSFRYAMRGGFAFDGNEKWRGEIAVGYEAEDFEDAGIDTLEALSVIGNVVWSPERDTTVTLAVGTSLAGSVNAGESGSVTYDGRLTLERQISDRLVSTLDLGIAQTDFRNTARDDLFYEAGIGLNYWVNRFTAVTADVSYENLDSTIGAQSYDAATVRLGVIWQN